MKKQVFISAIVVLIVLGSLVSANIVINEIELNPPGLDAGNEWVEVYNTGVDVINLTGWYIKDKDGNDFLFPDVMIDDFYVLDSLNAFVNANENVSLYNNDSLLVDFTGPLTDNIPSSGDNRTWSRVPDGTGSFVFQNGTRGFQNYVPVSQNETNESIAIENLSSSPACVIETNNVTLNAEVNGSCLQQVIFSFDVNGEETNVSGFSIGANKYRAIIPSSQLESSFFVFWKVFARNCFNQTNESSEESFYVNSKTYLEINPSAPDGENGWYLTGPAFTLTNPDAAEIDYRWNGNYFNYEGPFGLEGTPNNGNVTGGIHVLKYWSSVCGGEEQQEFTGKFDFAALTINDLEPANGEIIYGNSLPVISALLDDTYQSNSGINETSVLIFVDRVQVEANITHINNIKSYVIFEPTEELAEGQHFVEIWASDKAGRDSYKNWTFEIAEVSEIGLAINEPVEGVYLTKKVGFNITTTNEVELIEIINYNEQNPRFRTLCRNCEGYGHDRVKTRNLLEGENNIGVRATDAFGNFIEREARVIVDSKKPIITNTEPKDGLISSTFEILFRENNPTELLLYYGNSEDSRVAEVELSNCIKERGNTKCEIAVDLSDFNGRNVNYIFNLSDIAGNSEFSRERSAKVDTTAPVINRFYYNIDRRKVDFLFNVTEENFDSISYIDYADSPRVKMLCTRLKEGNICERRKSFSVGGHDLRIEAIDKAGNVAVVIEHLVFDVA